MTFIYIMMVVLVCINCAIVGWVIIKNKESDEQYKREISRIYGRKR